MALRVFCAGCSADDRAAAEAAVRAVFSDRPSTETWRVSLVKVQDRWSVTVEAPEAGVPRLALVALDGRIRETLAEAIASPEGAARQAGGEPEPPPTTTARSDDGPDENEAQTCSRCSRPFTVSYAREPGEPLEQVPVACPHCWHVGHILVGRNAALTRDYHANKLPV